MAGIELVYYERLETLAAVLSESLRSRIGDPSALFDRLTIVVPNQAMEAYLEQEISRRLGITPNLEFALLRHFLVGCLPGTGPWAATKILSQSHLHHLLVAILGEPSGRWREGCPEIVAYLERLEDPVARERRRYQLAGELSRIFTEYGFSRSAPVDGSVLEAQALLEVWRDVGAEGASRLSGFARWQQALWWEIFGEDGRIAVLEQETGTRYLTLAEALRLAPVEELRVPERFHVVGFAYTARLFIEALHRLSQRATVHVHGLLPSQAWAQGSQLEVNPVGLHPLLESWGPAGADLARLWQKVPSRTTSKIASSHRPAAHLLEAVQQDVVVGATAAAVPHSAANMQGIAFFECASIKREVEAVAGRIWQLLYEAEPGSLRPDDIAVIIAGSDQHAYQAQIEAVFANFDSLPLTLVELPAASKSRIIEAAGLLLALPFGQFNRRELLRLLVHPNLAGRGSDVDIEEWQRWCDKLGILYGADRAEQADGYLGVVDTIDGRDYEWDVYNWDQGLRRLTLGTFLSGPRSGEERLFTVGLSDYEPLELSTDTAGEASRFMLLASALIADARWLASEDERTRRTASQWAEVVATYLETYLTVRDTDEDPLEYVAVLRLARQVAEDCLGDGPMSYRMFYEFLRDALDALERVSHARLTGGVVVSTALALRAIPFEHVFVVGLGEGQFPNPELEAPLDLRFADPQLGDLTPANRDRYTFLEILLAARKSLTLSWVAREATSGEALEASSVVNQLRSVLEERFQANTGSEGKDALTVVHPLRRYHEAAPLYREARIEAAILAQRERLATSGEGGGRRPMPPLDKVRLDMNASEDASGQGKALRKALRLLPLPDEEVVPERPARIAVGDDRRRGPEPAPRRIKITLSQLRKFLESPLQGAARVQLGLRDEDDDVLEARRELVAASRLHEGGLLKGVMHELVYDGSPPEHIEDIYNQMLLPRAPLKSELPAAYFLQKNREKHVKILEQWRKNLLQDFGLKGPLRCLGIGVEDPRFEAVSGPIVFELADPTATTPGARVIVELSGVTDARTVQGDVVYMPFISKPSKDPHQRRKEFSRAFLPVAAAMAAGLESVDNPVQVFLNTLHTYVGKNPRKNFRFPVGPWHERFPDRTPLDYLQDLTRAMLFESHEYLFPVEFVAQHAGSLDMAQDSQGEEDSQRPNSRDLFEAWLEDALENDFSKPSFVYGPIKDYSRFGPPLHLDLAELARQRFPHLVGGNS
jgi:exodeoxyribonuclease V gamma subunit